MLVRTSLLLLSATLLAATPTMAKDKNKAADEIACAGVFGPESSEALVIETFGADNVVSGLVDGPEGSQFLATTVFPDDPDRQMVFSWFDEERMAQTSYIELSPSQAAPHGVRLGMNPAEVQAINGGPFDIGGFWWDYGGSAPIDEGALAGPQEGGCYISIRFSPQDEIPESIDVTAVTGEVVVRSDLPLLAEIGTSVTSLSLGYPLDPEE